MSTFKTLKTVS